MKTNYSMDTHCSEISEYKEKIQNLLSLWEEYSKAPTKDDIYM